MSKPCTVKQASLQVIERKLLTALQDEDKVAILATRQNLEDMIFALETADLILDRAQRCNELADGMRQLLKEAFQ